MHGDHLPQSIVNEVNYSNASSSFGVQFATGIVLKWAMIQMQLC